MASTSISSQYFWLLTVLFKMFSSDLFVTSTYPFSWGWYGVDFIYNIWCYLIIPLSNWNWIEHLSLSLVQLGNQICKRCSPLRTLLLFLLLLPWLPSLWPTWTNNMWTMMYFFCLDGGSVYPMKSMPNFSNGLKVTWGYMGISSL